MYNNFRNVSKQMKQDEIITSKTDSILKELFSQRMESALELSLRTDKEYVKAEKIAITQQNKLNKIEFSKKQCKAIDKVITTSCDLGAEYGRVAYRQGFKDCLKLVAELYRLL